MKQLGLIAFVLLAATVLMGCRGTSLTHDKVQKAVDTALAWTKKGGRVEVVGIQEIPNENSARADIRFEAFQYNSDQMGTPISNTQEAPKEPEINSPNFYDQLYKYGTQQTKVSSYTKSGVGILKHYSDGRWVLTGIQFNFVAVTSDVEVQ